MTEVTRMRRLVFQIRFYSNTKDRPQRQQITSIGSPSEVARGGPYIILYHSYIVLISFIHPHVICSIGQPLAKINRGSTERQRDVVVDINLAVTFGTGFDRTVL